MTIFTSLKDLGYQQAKTGDALEGQAQYALDNIVGFPEDVPAEARAELYEGYHLRFNDNNPPITYAVIDGHYVLATGYENDKKKIFFHDPAIIEGGWLNEDEFEKRWIDYDRNGKKYFHHGIVFTGKSPKNITKYIHIN